MAKLAAMVALAGGKVQGRGVRKVDFERLTLPG